MSPHGRPKGESLRPEAEGTPVSPHGRPKGESLGPEAEGTPVSAPGRSQAPTPERVARRVFQ